MQLFFTPLSQALRLVMHLGEPLPEKRLQLQQFSYLTLLLFFCMPFVMMTWTNGVGASTGMFVPALAVGATGERCLPAMVLVAIDTLAMIFVISQFSAFFHAISLLFIYYFSHISLFFFHILFSHFLQIFTHSPKVKLGCGNERFIQGRLE
jgi:hypothetical protein